MPRVIFSFEDFIKDCDVCNAPYQLNGHFTGLRITVPTALANQWPYNSNIYDFLQFFRLNIQQHGFIEIRGLALNKTNYTLAQKAPQQHAYSSNPFMTDYCQQPHQDTPPYPTAFALEEPRQYFATWLMTAQGVQTFMQFKQQNAQLSLEEVHRLLVPESLKQGWGILVNHESGIILIDNSHHCQLYHTRTCNFSAIDANPDFDSDAAMYAFNEIGLLNYIEQLDSRRGLAFRDENLSQEVARFMQKEQLS